MYCIMYSVGFRVRISEYTVGRKVESRADIAELLNVYAYSLRHN